MPLYLLHGHKAIQELNHSSVQIEHCTGLQCFDYFLHMYPINFECYMFIANQVSTFKRSVVTLTDWNTLATQTNAINTFTIYDDAGESFHEHKY